MSRTAARTASLRDGKSSRSTRKSIDFRNRFGIRTVIFSSSVPMRGLRPDLYAFRPLFCVRLSDETRVPYIIPTLPFPRPIPPPVVSREPLNRPPRWLRDSHGPGVHARWTSEGRPEGAAGDDPRGDQPPRLGVPDGEQGPPRGAEVRLPDPGRGRGHLRLGDRGP